MPGRRADNSALYEAGTNAYYWSSTLETQGTDTKPWYLFANKTTSNTAINVATNWWCNRADACSIRPVMINPTDSPDDSSGSLDGFTDEDGWQ